jgi:hypothetical protein
MNLVKSIHNNVLPFKVFDNHTTPTYIPYSQICKLFYVFFKYWDLEYFKGLNPDPLLYMVL